MAKLCIYHGNCADGFAAAWVVRKFYGKDVEFYPGVHQNPPPDVTGRDVVLVDFSYRVDVVKQMLESAKSVTLIDHHKTAIDDLDELIQVNAIIASTSLEHSGAMLAWMYFFPQHDPPQLLKHIEDRDLWRFVLPGTREIQATVFSYPYNFEVWDDLMAKPVEELQAEGKAIERKHHKDVEELIGVCTRMMQIGGHVVPVANLPYTLTSDAGHLLAKDYPFAGCYWDTAEGRVFSLRSREDGLDVGEIAKQYGGGGHRHASGFRAKYDSLDQFNVVVDSNNG